MAARASVNAAFAALLVSFASAPSITGSMVSSWVLNTDCAAAIRLAGSGDSKVSPPRAASTVRRRRLLRRTAAALSGSLSTAAPVAASMTLPSVPVTKAFLVSGSAASRPSPSALMMAKASGLPEVATTPTASSVSEKSSLANLATASSNGPAKAGTAKAATSSSERQSARKRSRKLAGTVRPRRELGRRRQHTAFSFFLVSWKSSCRQLRRSGGLIGSGTLTAALVGLGVVVAALLANPVADQVLGAVELLRPCIAGHQTRGLPHHVELAVGFDFANEHRLGDVMVRQHLRSAAGQVLGFGAGQRVDHLVGVGRLHLLDRLDPHVETDDVCFHRIVGHALRVLGVGLPGLDELLVGRVLDRLEVVPGGEMAEQRFGVDAGEFFFTDRERDNRNVGRLDALVAEFLVEGNVGVAVDGGDHGGLLAGRAELLDVGHDRLPVTVTERRVVDHDVFLLDALRLQVGFENLVGGARIDVVGAGQHPALHLFVLHQVVDRRDSLLVRRRTGVEHVALALFTLVLHGVEQDVVQLLEHREHGLARHRSPAAEHDRDLVLGDQLAGLFGKQRPVRRGIDHDSLKLLAEYAALLVLLVDQEKDGVLQRGFADGHGAGKRVQDADLDGVVGGFGIGECGQTQNQAGGRREPSSAAHLRYIVGKLCKHEMSSP